jgi:arginine decarboxylase
MAGYGQSANSDPILADAGLLRAWHAAMTDGRTPFTIPGHKRRAGRISAALGELLDADVPLYGGLDEVKLTHRMLAEAELRAASLWGADWCRFSVGGSTHGNQALLLAATRPGDTVLVTRTAHRSTLSGLVLAGVHAVWLRSDVDEDLGVPTGVAPATLEQAVRDHPGAVAVLLVEPSYLGTLSDRAELVRIAHAAGMAVLVDQAWGAHLGFAADLPHHALEHGADAMVLSAHKTLPAYSQACIVLARGARLDVDRLDRGFEATHTTSPAGSILASTDASRAVLEQSGPALLAALRETVDAARESVDRVDGLHVLRPADFPAGRFDPLKLVIGLSGTGADGVAVERLMIDAGFPVEMADRDTIVPIVTMLDGPDEVDGLGRALTDSVEQLRGQPRARRAAVQWTAAGTAAMDPRSAFFADRRTVPIDDATGQICAEIVAPYPPGIPLLVPGEVISRATIDALVGLARDGTRIAYAADPELRTLQVVA